MEKYIKYIVILLITLLIVSISIIFILNKKEEEPQEEIQVATVEEPKEVEEDEEETLVVDIAKNETQPIPEEPKKDASTLTQEIYDMNSEIGTLNIPKTGLTTQIFSNTTVSKMEEMPCFLYTTGGLNQTGVTLFVGHNRVNGTIFSDNNKLEEGDKFYFTDYEGVEKEYEIYSKFVTTESDTSYLNEKVDSPVIALSCCTDADDENRIIILGKTEK